MESFVFLALCSKSPFLGVQVLLQILWFLFFYTQKKESQPNTLLLALHLSTRDLVLFSSLNCFWCVNEVGRSPNRVRLYILFLVPAAKHWANSHSVDPSGPLSGDPRGLFARTRDPLTVPNEHPGKSIPPEISAALVTASGTQSDDTWRLG